MYFNENLYRVYGHPSQHHGVRLMTFEDGMARGTRVVQIHNSCGLELDVLPDNGLDMGHCRMKGVNIPYITKNGLTSPWRTLPVEGEFDHSFSGGLLYTCGLLNVGPSCADRQFHPLHGRYHSLTSHSLSLDEDDEWMTIKAVIRESEQWAHCLDLIRVIKVHVDQPWIVVTDRLINRTPEPCEIMMLYHLNFGAPFLDQHTLIQWPGHETTPRDEFSRSHVDKVEQFDLPVPQMAERVYYHHHFQEPVARVTSPTTGLSVQVRWDQDTLPFLNHWKTSREGEYCLALEPSTSMTNGRVSERERGGLITLEPWGERRHQVELRFEVVS